MSCPVPHRPRVLERTLGHSHVPTAPRILERTLLEVRRGPSYQNTSVSRRDSVTVTVVCPCTKPLRPLLLQGAGASESRAMCMLGDCALKAGSDDVVGIGDGRVTEVLP